MMCRPGSVREAPAGAPARQVRHHRNLWRDFPDHLAAEAVEREYQSWAEGGSRRQIATTYAWKCCRGREEGDKFIEYEITFHDMRQQRVTPPQPTPPRKIRRLLAPSQ